MDGNGEVGALSDGIMAVRFMFGAAFPGDALTAGAISPNATRNTSEIRTYLEELTDLTTTPAPTITIATPDGDSIFTQGEAYTLTWTDNISENVKIDLYQGDNFVQTLFANTPSDGSEIWTVPSSLGVANDYRITIASVNSSSISDNSDFFSITDLPVDPETGVEYQPYQLLVKLPVGGSSAQLANFADDFGTVLSVESVSQFSDTSGLGDWRVINFGADTDVEALKQVFEASGQFGEVEFNYQVSINVIPNDPQFSALWGLNNTGQTGGGFDADIDAAEAWDVEQGSDAVVVAVIDTGIDYNHQDLAANMWRNLGEIAGNGIDDDLNGFVDDVYGYDFINNDGNPMDDHSHGTHVAGTIGAVGNNNLGIVGVSHEVSLMALKFLGANGSGWTTDAARAVDYAVSMGADIMNASFGGGGFSSVMNDALNRANQAGVLFVAAAGNDYGNNNDLSPHYPSSYDVPNVVAVAATDHRDQLAWFSNYGSTSVDLAAPGVNVLSTIPGNSYASYDGTSMATPHVAGAAALLLAQDPTLTVTQLKQILMDTTDPIASLNGKVVTGGRLNVGNAITSIAKPTIALTVS